MKQLYICSCAEKQLQKKTHFGTLKTKKEAYVWANTRKNPVFTLLIMKRRKCYEKPLPELIVARIFPKLLILTFKKNFYNVHPNFPAAETCIIRKRIIKRIYVGSLTFCCLILLLDVIFKTSVIVFFHNFSPPEKSFNYKGVFMSIYASFYPR